MKAPSAHITFEHLKEGKSLLLLRKCRYEIQPTNIKSAFLHEWAQATACYTLLSENSQQQGLYALVIDASKYSDSNTQAVGKQIIDIYCLQQAK
jgi:hypothetical protein